MGKIARPSLLALGGVVAAGFALRSHVSRRTGSAKREQRRRVAQTCTALLEAFSSRVPGIQAASLVF